MSTPTVKLTGVLDTVFQTEQVTERFQKRLFWLREPEQPGLFRPSTWEIELQQADCDQLDKYERGTTLEVEVEVKGYRYQRKDGSAVVGTTLRCVGLRSVSPLPVRQTSYPDYAARREQPRQRTIG